MGYYTPVFTNCQFSSDRNEFSETPFVIGQSGWENANMGRMGDMGKIGDNALYV